VVKEPARDVANYVSSNGFGELGVNVFIGNVKPVSQFVPEEAVFVLGETGRASNRVHSGLREIRFPSVQVRVRSNDFGSGFNLIQGIHDLLFRAILPGYIDCRPLQSEPVFFEEDENGNFEWFLNFELKYETEV
jgi:hypothetical protein